MEASSNHLSSPTSQRRRPQHTNKRGLPILTQRILWEDIEAEGGRFAKLDDVYIRRPDLYGTDGSALRRAVRRKVYWWRQLTESEYSALGDTLPSSQLDDDEDDDDDDDDNDLLQRSIPSARQQQQQQHQQAPLLKQHQQAPISKQPSLLSTLPQKRPQALVNMDQFNSTFASMAVTTASRGGSVSTNKHIIVSLDKPESHSPFLLLKFQNVKTGGVTHDSFDIVLLKGDLRDIKNNRYKATQIGPNLVLIEMPSLPGSYVEHYDNLFDAQKKVDKANWEEGIRADKVYCDKQHDGHTIFRNMLRMNESRNVQMYLLEFPEDMVLNTHPYSPHANGKMVTEWTRYEYTEYIPSDAQGVDLEEFPCVDDVVYWRIAIVDKNPRLHQLSNTSEGQSMLLSRLKKYHDQTMETDEQKLAGFPNVPGQQGCGSAQGIQADDSRLLQEVERRVHSEKEATRQEQLRMVVESRFQAEETLRLQAEEKVNHGETARIKVESDLRSETARRVQLEEKIHHEEQLRRGIQKRLEDEEALRRQTEEDAKLRFQDLEKQLNEEASLRKQLRSNATRRVQELGKKLQSESAASNDHRAENQRLREANRRLEEDRQLLHANATAVLAESATKIKSLEAANEQQQHQAVQGQAELDAQQRRCAEQQQQLTCAGSHFARQEEELSHLRNQADQTKQTVLIAPVLVQQQFVFVAPTSAQKKKSTPSKSKAARFVFEDPSSIPPRAMHKYDMRDRPSPVTSPAPRKGTAKRSPKRNQDDVTAFPNVPLRSPAKKFKLPLELGAERTDPSAVEAEPMDLSLEVVSKVQHQRTPVSKKKVMQIEELD